MPRQAAKNLRRNSGFTPVRKSFKMNNLRTLKNTPSTTKTKQSGCALFEKHGGVKGNEPYEAIRLLGRAQLDLALHECRAEMAEALALCGVGYESVGLLWAARGNFLLALNQALKEFWDHGTVTSQAIACVRRLIWVELQLGRVPYVLSWIQVLLALHSAVEKGEAEQSRFEEYFTEIDRVLGALLLRTELFDLKELPYLPKVLDQLQLDAASMALLFALGHEDVLRNEGAIPSGESADAVLDFFTEWAALKGFKELPMLPEFVDRQTLHLTSNVLGCSVHASVPNDDKSLFLAEAVLAVLESFLSTSLDSPFIPYTPRLHLQLSPRDFMDEPMSFVVKLGQPKVVEIFHSKDRADDDSPYESQNPHPLKAEGCGTQGQSCLEGLVVGQVGIGTAPGAG
jgi:hypothetical protein